MKAFLGDLLLAFCAVLGLMAIGYVAFLWELGARRIERERRRP